MSRRIIFGMVLVLTLSVLTCVFFSAEAGRMSAKTTDLFDECWQYTNDVSMFLGARSLDERTVHQEKEDLRQGLEDLEETQKGMQRTRASFNDYQDAVLKMLDGNMLLDSSYEIAKNEINKASSSYRDDIVAVANLSRDVAFALSIISFAVCLAVTLCLGLALAQVVELTKERGQQIDAQERLARQQAHEQRNLFAPAISLLDSLLEGASFDENDVRTALALLRDVEEIHQSRLDCFKILQGNYQLKGDTLDIVGFMRERLTAELLIARAHGSSNVVFRASPDAESLHVETDVYILTHIVSNLLSNARKHTWQGEILLAFTEARNGVLVFQVKDTGLGIPKQMRAKLFSGVTTTTDSRGTGLGLPSCDLFAKTAGGYIRLVNSKCGSPMGRTVFEFAVAGRILTTRASSDSVPESDLPACRCVIVDDSEMTRKGVIRRLQAVSKTAKGPWLFEQYPTVEAAQPALVGCQDSNTIVTLDDDLQSKGGQLTGEDAIKWLLSMQFPGIIVSATGDSPEAHLRAGAHFAWGKPIASTRQVTTDLQAFFKARDAPASPRRRSSFRSTMSSGGVARSVSDNYDGRKDDDDEIAVLEEGGVEQPPSSPPPHDHANQQRASAPPVLSWFANNKL